MKDLNTIFITVFAITFSSLFMVGCNQEIPVDDTMLKELSSSTAVTTDTTTIKMTATVVTTQSSTIKKESKTTTIITSEDTNQTTTEVSILNHSLDEINDIAIDLYSKACEKYREVLIDGSYGLDLQQSVSDQTGKRYYLVDNPYYPEMESVLDDWHTVFNENYDDLVYQSYIMYDGCLYGYTGIQQKNTNYDSTSLTYYYNDSDNELTFKATCHYSTGDKVFKFCIVYYPETDTWRVSKFTMPY